MKKHQVEVKNELGIHARVAALIVKEASKYKSNIQLEKNGITANCKSILGILALGASKGTKLNLMVEGEDEDKAFNAIKELFERGFHEGE